MRLRFPHAARLTQAGEFARMKREGRSFPGRYMVLSVLPGAAGADAPVRLGIITTKRIGGAVVRNTVRRRLRELFRAVRLQLQPGVWLVLIARAPAAGASFLDLRQEWEKLLQRSRVLPSACSS